MMLTTRYLTEKISHDLKKKMVFLGGPRQVGKTTLAESLLREVESPGALLNWDDEQDRARVLDKDFPIGKGLLVFDELHNYHRWRNYLKGLFDKRKAGRTNIFK